MLSKEHPKLPSGVLDAPVQFWTRQAAAGGGGSEYWLNVATRTPQKEEPVLGRGGIMADGMGLGKLFMSNLELTLPVRQNTQHTCTDTGDEERDRPQIVQQHDSHWWVSHPRQTIT